jgi:Zn-dependent protease with chaperone function
LEKFPKYGGGNSKSSDFAATIINQFAGADTQNAFTSGGNRPTRDVWLIQKFIYHRGSKAVILTNGIYKNLNRGCLKRAAS